MSKPRPRNHTNSHKRKSFSRNHQAPGNWVWGTHAVIAALNNPARKTLRLVGTENGLSRLPQPVAKMQKLGASEIDNLLPRDAVHQGLAGEFEPLPAAQIEDLIESNIHRIVVLDQVNDPHNLGAIFRSAAAFGFGAIILQTRNAPAITGIVAKTAAGAVEAVQECRAVNIARSIEALNVAGFHTVGLAGDGAADIERALDGASKVAIVLGAEGSGLRRGVAQACAELARIPISTDMESLNVSNAAAIAFYEAQRVGSGR